MEKQLPFTKNQTIRIRKSIQPNRKQRIFVPKKVEKLENFDGKFLTTALADRRSLDIASRRESHSLSLINIDTERGAAAVDDLTQALRLRLNDTGKLRAA